MVDYNKAEKELLEAITDMLEDSFKIFGIPAVEVVEDKVETQFGYKIRKVVRHYETEPVNFYLKWGFPEDEFLIDDSNTKEYAIPNREVMDMTVEQTIEDVREDFTIALAKLQLEKNYVGVAFRADNPILFSKHIDEECSSKFGSVDFVKMIIKIIFVKDKYEEKIK